MKRRPTLDRPRDGAVEGSWSGGGGRDPASPARDLPGAKAFRWLDDRRRGMVVSVHPFADAEVAHIEAPPVEVSQEGSVREPGRFHLVLHVSGHGRYRSRHAEFRQGPGDVVLMDGEAPCRAIHPDGTRIVRWSLPESALTPFICVPRRIFAHRLAAGDGLTTVLGQSMRMLAQRDLRLDAQAESAMVVHLCGLAGVALDRVLRPGIQPRRHLRTLQRQRILNYMRINLHDPRLSARRAASALGISTRWLHALLQDSRTGFADLVASQRLDRCMALLRDPVRNHVSIAEIAFSAGFNDLSTFYRRFRERYGTSPGAMRRDAAGASAGKGLPKALVR